VCESFDVSGTFVADLSGQGVVWTVLGRPTSAEVQAASKDFSKTAMIILDLERLYNANPDDGSITVRRQI